ncbi:hypothetical protein [Agathobaculum butyriciproducens]|uniref:hypothetical protein n=1 Tax=Agathobaculum butyriciproducens TaxID=1628085 RepID=UPI0036D35E27
MLIATVSIIIALIFSDREFGCHYFEVYLSRRESKLPGLVLPGITFLGELFILLNVVSSRVFRRQKRFAAGCS